LNELIAADPVLPPAHQRLFESVVKQRITPLRDFLYHHVSGPPVLPKVRERVFGKFQSYLLEAVGVIDRQLIPNAADDRSRVFCTKLKADCFRYLAEFASADPDGPSQEANKFYLEALQCAKEKLPATDLVLLATAVNFSVFRYDHLHDLTAAISLASETLAAYREAAQKPGDVTESDAYEEAAFVTILEQNIDLWKREAS
jgi:hypothetical protein